MYMYILRERCNYGVDSQPTLNHAHANNATAVIHVAIGSSELSDFFLYGVA